MAFVDKYGPWALIVGGSEGVGAELARQLADEGLNLVLCARKPGPLGEVADECRKRGAEVRTLSVDVTEPDAALDKVREHTDDIEVGLLVYMAGTNIINGPFVDVPLDMVRKVIAMNVEGQVIFTHHYAGLMKQRGHGGVVLVGSWASFLGIPRVSAYSGSKAFSRIFSEAVYGELHPLGVDVLHISLGFTATPAMARLGYDLSTADDPVVIARELIDHVADGPVWVAGGQARIDESYRRMTMMPRSAAVASVTLPPKD